MYEQKRHMYEQKTNQSNLLTVRLILGCALWSVKYSSFRRYFWFRFIITHILL